MILTCNSCEKKFVVPDSAISASGRMVQCGSCGNKWKQFPISLKKITKKEHSPALSVKKRVAPTPKGPKRKAVKKVREINLYSPEYLAKKHGIKLKDGSSTGPKKPINKKSVNFGFYNSLIVFIAFLTLFFGILINTQEMIIDRFPESKIYLEYFFETINNIRTIIQNFFNS
tara:strand:+ start:64 stop:579 length:516 start_codon:yes stop_codon:yes gene_type:complete